MKCSVCGGESFSPKTVLWGELVNDWQLSSAEAAYVNRQQEKHVTPVALTCARSRSPTLVARQWVRTRY